MVEDLMARPTLFNESLAEEICVRIMCGDSLAEICRDEEMPAYRTVMRWLKDDLAFRQNYASAREDQGHADADAIADIAKRIIKGEIDPAAGRAAIDALKWTAGKRQPKAYGDASTIKHTGADGGPVQFANMTEAEIDARLAAALAGNAESPAPEAKG